MRIIKCDWCGEENLGPYYYSEVTLKGEALVYSINRTEEFDNVPISVRIEIPRDKDVCKKCLEGISFSGFKVLEIIPSNSDLEQRILSLANSERGKQVVKEATEANKETLRRYRKAHEVHLP